MYRNTECKKGRAKNRTLFFSSYFHFPPPLLALRRDELVLSRDRRPIFSPNICSTHFFYRAALDHDCPHSRSRRLSPNVFLPTHVFIILTTDCTYKLNRLVSGFESVAMSRLEETRGVRTSVINHWGAAT